MTLINEISQVAKPSSSDSFMCFNMLLNILVSEQDKKAFELLKNIRISGSTAGAVLKEC